LKIEPLFSRTDSIFLLRIKFNSKEFREKFIFFLRIHLLGKK